MPKLWLIIDVSNLAWKYYHSFKPPDLEFLVQVWKLHETFDTTHVAFAFDSATNLRVTDMPGYKNLSEDAERLRQRGEVDKCIARLRDDYLPALGFRNLFSCEGYEADDVIASLANRLGNNEAGMIVSNDSDLYQLLDPGVRMFDGNLTHTEASFRSRYYNLSPQKWHLVKALGGCKGDVIPGCQGVGEVTALKYFTGRIHEIHRSVLQDIKVFMASPKYALYKRLTKLPYPGCPSFRPESHRWPHPEEFWKVAKVRVGGPVDEPGLPAEMLRGKK